MTHSALRRFAAGCGLRTAAAVTAVRALAVTVVTLGAVCAPLSIAAQAAPIPPRLSAVLPGLTASERQVLADEGVLRIHTENEPLRFRYLPEVSIAAGVRQGFSRLRPSVVNEVLYLLPRPLRPDGSAYESEATLLRDLGNTFRSVSSLSGIEYGITNVSVLFDDVYVIDSLQSRNRLPDPLVPELPAQSSVLVHLVDSNFGTSYFAVDYIASPDAVAMAMTNARSLTYIFPVVAPERLRFQLVAVPLDEALLLYGVVGLETGALFRRMVDLPAAFQRRIRALADWFVAQVYPARP